MQIGLHRKEKNMKQAWNDLKSFVTVAFSLTVITLIIIVAINKNILIISYFVLYLNYKVFKRDWKYA